MDNGRFLDAGRCPTPRQGLGSPQALWIPTAPGFPLVPKSLACVARPEVDEGTVI
ncbi:MAG: hypothetical protein VST69_07715 [Nitrospirota bacterium]|nr:hypothetical protein [Nitrospirota bacterium]